MQRMLQCRAIGWAGHTARAMAVAAYAGPRFEDDLARTGIDGQIIAALLRDIVAGAL